MAGVQIDGVNNKIDFDDDLDTSISANTDDTLVIEAGGNTMATITATTFTINDGTTITTADNSDTLSLVSTDADANVGPNFVFYRNSGSPADSDQLGNVLFKGRNDNSEDVSYAQFVSQIKDASNGTEDARFAIFTMVAGSQISRFEALPTETVFNENSVDLDFRVESNGNANAIFVNGGTDSVTIGASGVVQTLAGIPFYRNDTSSIYTHDVSGTDDTAALNTAYGITALDAITTGDNNTVVGSGAGSALNTGHRNTLMGQGAGGLLTTATHTVAIGNAAASGYDTETHNLAIGHVALGGSVAGGEFNVAIGNLSLDALTSADNNVALGYNAGSALTTGATNVLIGSEAASAGTMTGANNVVIGYQSGKNISSGHDSVLVGENAGRNMNTGQNNVVVGKDAGSSMTGGGNATIVGYQAGQNNTAHELVAIGSMAANANTSGDGIVAIGRECYDGADTENHNMAIGTGALGGAVDGGEFNVAVGNYTLDALTSGDNNTAVGYQALTDATTGGDNTAVGFNSLPNVLAGTDNTGLGRDAGSSITGGSANICIGSGANVADAAQDFGIAMGFEITAAANDFSFGKTSNVVTNDFDADANWSRSSDERLKTNITNIDWKALDFINELRPVTFNWKASQDVSNTMVEHNPNKNLMNTTVTIDGLIAQEVKSAMDKHNINNFGGWKERQNNEDKEKTQTLSKEAFVMPIIKAIQELSAKVKALEEA